MVTLVLVAGCGGGLYEFDTDPGTAGACRELVQALPDTVLGESSTPVDSERVAAWGDPRVVLRCGVVKPAELTPVSRCDEVDGIGWFTQKNDDSTVFTTVGRDPDVSVQVPNEYDPAGAALVDVAEAVAQHSEPVRPCV